MLEEKDDSLNQIINGLQNSVAHKSTTRHDLLTYASAKNYIEKKHPKILFLGLGETDEFAHKRQYDQYLQKAKQFDLIPDSHTQNPNFILKYEERPVNKINQELVKETIAFYQTTSTILKNKKYEKQLVQ